MNKCSRNVFNNSIIIALIEIAIYRGTKGQIEEKENNIYTLNETLINFFHN